MSKYTDIETTIDRIESRVKKIENDKMGSNNIYHAKYNDPDDEIDLQVLFVAIWGKKIQILFITFFFSISSVLYALSLPNIYKASTILAPTQQEAKGGLGGLAAQYGGLAAMAGINIGGNAGADRIVHAITLLKSWAYIEELVSKYDLKATFMATEGWHKESNKLEYKNQIYNVDTQKWREKGGKYLEPSSYETFEKVVKMISLTVDSETGLINLQVSHFSPYVAKEVVEILTRELNGYFKEIDRLQAQKNIEILSQKINETANSEMRQIFYSMIENHSKTLLMTEVNDQYLIKTVVPAMLPEKKDKPGRAMICILGTLLGGMFSILWVLFRYFIKTKRN